MLFSEISELVDAFPLIFQRFFNAFPLKCNILLMLFFSELVYTFFSKVSELFHAFLLKFQSLLMLFSLRFQRFLMLFLRAFPLKCQSFFIPFSEISVLFL